MGKFTLDEIRSAQTIAQKYGLDNADRFCNTDLADLQNICNGIGAEWMPEWSRKLLDKRYSVMQVPAMIHDLDYHLGTGAKDDFSAANDRLKQNGYKMAKALYSWKSLSRYLVMNDARRLGNVCDAFGWKAYVEAIETRLTDATASETAPVIDTVS